MRIIRGVVASDESLDSHGSILKADGWDLKRYATNPVIMWAHNTGGGLKSTQPEDVLGRGEAKVEGSRLIADLYFSPAGMNPKADLVFSQMQNKIIRGISVGFNPLEYHFENQGGDNEIIVFDKMELIEISVVPVPSNPNTLVKEFRGYLQECDSQECAAQLLRKDTKMDADTVVTLPAALATILSVETVEDAVREISKRDLEIDKYKMDVAAALARAEAAEAKLNEKERVETERAVDALIDTGRISKERRDAALVLARTAPAAFLDLYPAVVEAPRAHLMTRVVEPADDTPVAKIVDDEPNPIEVRAAELVAQGKSHLEAYTVSMNEYRANKGA
jgi:HK97 family phage prohead protease